MKRKELKSLLRGAGDDLVREAVSAWLGEERVPAKTRGSKTALIAEMAAAMEDETRVLQRLEALPQRLADLLEPFFSAGTALPVPELFQDVGRNFKSRYDLEACLAALQREGWLFPATDKRWAGYDGPGYAEPGELVRSVTEHRRRTRRCWTRSALPS